MDEVSFGPSREDRPPSRRRRAFTIAFSAAGVAAAGAALAVLAPSAYHALASRYTIARPAAPSASPARLPSPGCRPVHPDWPSLAGLPAGMRPGALPVIADAQFSGRCSLASAGAGSACRGSRGPCGGDARARGQESLGE